MHQSFCDCYANSNRAKIMSEEITFTIGICLFLFVLFVILITDKRTEEERLADMKKEADRKKLDSLRR